MTYSLSIRHDPAAQQRSAKICARTADKVRDPQLAARLRMLAEHFQSDAVAASR